MTIEIHELVIEARVVGATPEENRAPVRLRDIAPAEREQLIDTVAQRVLRILREEKEY